MLEVVPRRVHFIGIGGTGMSGLAKILLAMGYRVTGSDLASTPITQRVELLGGTCYIGHREENIGDAELVVISSAINPDNPELCRAEEKVVPVIHRAELLAWLMRRQKGIAVAGAHGKTTTTSMLAMTLEKNGLDPTIIVGGELNDISGNAKLGSGEYLVAESDESDGSFLKLEPLGAIVTNIDDDHLNYYGSIDNMKAAFKAFLNKIPEEGKAVVCLDDDNIRNIVNYGKMPLVTYGFNNQADYTLKRVRFCTFKSFADVYFKGAYLGSLELSVPGKHNLSNALAVVAATRWLGLDFEQTSRTLKEFTGVGRRFQLVGEVQGVKVIDDYAHHPTEIAATLQAARQVHQQRVIAVFQPHRYTRTALLKDRFGSALSEADVTIVSEIYSAGEAPIAGVTAQMIVDAAKRNKDRQVVYYPTTKEAVDYLVSIVRPGDLVLTLGAGDIWTAGVDLINRLQSTSPHK